MYGFKEPIFKNLAYNILLLGATPTSYALISYKNNNTVNARTWEVKVALALYDLMKTDLWKM